MRLPCGRDARFDVVVATVLWDYEARYVETEAVGAGTLVGMAMLDNHALSIQVRDDKRVVIRASR